MVRTLSASGIHSELLSVPSFSGSATGEAIFELINQEFSKQQIPWSNCLSLGCDNANVMTGSKKGVVAFCKEKNPEIFLSGCTLHLVHIGAEKGADVLPVSPSDLLSEIYHYFKKSSLRSHRLVQFQELHNKEVQKMLKHVPTRWLSISRCLDRLMDNWDPLKDFFKEECNTKQLSQQAKNKAKLIYNFLRSRSTKLYMLFLKHSVKIFDEFLTLNQSDTPRITKLLGDCLKLIRNIMTRFVAPTAFAGNKLLKDIDYKSSYNI